MSQRALVTIELRFTTADDARAIGERIRESVAMIVGHDALEEFRVKSLPLTPPKKSDQV